MTARRFCILDVEARLSPDAVLRVGLKEIYACATLVFDEAADGSFSNFELECCELGYGGEAAVLMMPPRVDEEHSRGSILATYAGS